jgi:hypothetical protein
MPPVTTGLSHNLKAFTRKYDRYTIHAFTEPLHHATTELVL